MQDAKLRVQIQKPVLLRSKNQQIYDCPEELSFWQDEPAGYIYLNYISNTECMKIVSQGKKQHKTEGYLEDIAVGNK